MVGRGSAVGKIDSISRRHAVILYIDGNYYIEDGDGQGRPTRNHTFVNDQQVPFPGRRLLHDADRIRICDFVCTFHLGTVADRILEQPAPKGARPAEDRNAVSSVEASLEHDSSGQVLQAQPAQKLRVLLEISKSLSSTLEVDDLLSRLVEHLFELFKQADRGFVFLWDRASGALEPRVFKARRATDAPDARFSGSVVRQCVEEVRAKLANDVIREFPDSGSVAGLPIRSLMCAPLWSPDGEPLGAIQLDAQGASRKFAQEDLELLLGVASQASIALYNARLYRESLLNQRRERDLEVAHQVQRALLPHVQPIVPGYDFYAYYESALEVGGDYYDFVPLSGQRLGILLGDVAGKGVPAALVMVKFSVEARVCLLAEPDLEAAVRRLNTVMYRVGLSEMFVTLVAVVLDPAAHTASLVNAGHPSPLLYRRATGAVERATPREATAMPIGPFDTLDFACCQVEFQPGDSLVLFSDGITEAMDACGRQFKSGGAAAVLGGAHCPPGEMGDRLIQAAKKHASGCGQQDDITLLCFGRSGE
jgi:serine phosphatase RsbU (regulator of sigma subunit)